ncbi:MAG: hypothetical protein AB7H80_13055 [Candidatus Kapaibacterium sp.]
MNASFPGDFIPGHSSVAPPGQAVQSTLLDRELTSNLSLLEHSQSSL